MKAVNLCCSWVGLRLWPFLVIFTFKTVWAMLSIRGRIDKGVNRRFKPHPRHSVGSLTKTLIFNLCLILVQPRKSPGMTEKVLTGT